MKRLLVVLEAGDRRKSSVVRALAYRELFANNFSACFENRQPLRTRDWLDNCLVSNDSNSLIREEATVETSEEGKPGTDSESRSQGRHCVPVKIASFPFVHDVCNETNARVVYDFVDAVWLRDESPDEFNKLLQRVDAVTTDNDFIARYVRPFNADCTVVSDAPALEEFDRRREPRLACGFTLRSTNSSGRRLSVNH